MTEVDSRLAELGARYRASLPIKRASVELAWQSLCAKASDPVRLDSLQRVVHRIAGSAASYGYDEIGSLAALADEGLDSLRERGQINRNATSVNAALSALSPIFKRLIDALAHGCEWSQSMSRTH
jgi:HPt (histidine-containing phosphotransfer) domain-containing protein